MAKYASREELAQKIDWEGGIDDFLLGYGFSEEDVDGEADPELWSAAADVVQARRAYLRAREALEALVEEYYG